MNQVDASQFIFDRFKSLSDNKIILPVKIPNGQQFDDKGDPFIEIFDTPNTTERFPLSVHTFRGLITANVYYQSKHYGDLFGKEQSQLIIDNFNDGLIFEDIEIYRPPEMSSFIDRNDGWWYNSVTIYYEFRNKRI